MSANNQAVIIGRAGNSPAEDIRHTKSGTAVAEVRLAVNRTQKDSSGNPITDWIPAQFWDKNAERLAEFVNKGDLISISGAIRIENWERDGKKGQKFYLHGESFQMLESRKAREERGDAPPKKSNPAPQDFGSDEFVDDDELPPF